MSLQINITQSPCLGGMMAMVVGGVVGLRMIITPLTRRHNGAGQVRLDSRVKWQLEWSGNVLRDNFANTPKWDKDMLLGLCRVDSSGWLLTTTTTWWRDLNKHSSIFMFMQNKWPFKEVFHSIICAPRREWISKVDDALLRPECRRGGFDYVYRCRQVFQHFNFYPWLEEDNGGADVDLLARI